ncbi:MAG: hypothetical protein ACMUHM_02380 [Thermoplasmatota archaeon]
MILPKGTVEFQMTGGENAIEEVMDKIRTEGLTGYVLVLGKLQNSKGEDEDITGQLVFKEGGAVLCESVLKSRSHKGKDGIFPFLKAMMVDDASIEFKSKIDVEPPMAFFKECSIDDTYLDIDDFKNKMKVEEEERKKAEEDKRRMEEKKVEIQDNVDEWLSQGFLIPSFPAVMEKGFKELDEWYEELSRRMGKIGEYTKWLSSVTEVEVEDQKDELFEKMKKPEEMQAIESAKKKFQDSLDAVNDKRQEILKWVNLWKEEGYNTINIEERMEEDLTTAWNAMTEFMDHIQHLKDFREELEKIKKKHGEDDFGAEIRDIDFLLNDPDEIDTIERMIKDLKETIEDEKKEKAELLKKAEEIEGRGYSIQKLKEISKGRLRPFKEMFNLMMNNILRLTEIKEELADLDRRDIPEEIDKMEGSIVDPWGLDSYEEKLLELKDRIEGFRDARDEILAELKDLMGEGFAVEGLEEGLQLPVEKFRQFRADLVAKVTELKDLGQKLTEMDRRWLDADFEEAEEALKDPSRIDWLKDKIGRIQEKIDLRERKREEAKDDMETWDKEGFMVTRLKDVIEGDLSDFKDVHKEMKERVQGARGLLEKLSSLDLQFFKDRADDVRTRIMDPFDLEGAEDALTELSGSIEADKELRDKMAGRIEKLKKEGWSFKGLESILEIEPYRLQDTIDDLEDRVSRLSSANDDMASWDEVEKRNLSEKVKELRGKLKDLGDVEASIDIFKELQATIQRNREKRENIKKTLDEWKDIGYIISSTSDLQEGNIEALSDSFEELREKIGELESIQEEFDALDTKHFPKEAEEIEFKLNDPGLLEDIRAEMKDIRSKIQADKEKREEYRQRIDDYIDQGFMGAEKLSSFLDEDIAIVDLEFRNFAKEIDQFRKLKEKVGFLFNVNAEEPEEVEAEEDEE